uniref:Uncharacterized protein n=1 Tax=Hyaloperonospora arabidopsidis (strain Emoy2) TaxID=559515 RepID=M4C2Z8_HYAAE
MVQSLSLCARWKVLVPRFVVLALHLGEDPLWFGIYLRYVQVTTQGSKPLEGEDLQLTLTVRSYGKAHECRGTCSYGQRILLLMFIDFVSESLTTKS